MCATRPHVAETLELLSECVEEVVGRRAVRVAAFICRGGRLDRALRSMHMRRRV